jgi:hypothetical protein
MKKIVTLLLTSACALALTNNSFGCEASASEKVSGKNKTLEDNNTLLHTLILQNKLHFEFDSSHQSKFKEFSSELDNLYKANNAQLNDKSLHIPMSCKSKYRSNGK